jgi:hypothetical protein
MLKSSLVQNLDLVISNWNLGKYAMVRKHHLKVFKGLSWTAKIATFCQITRF